MDKKKLQQIKDQDIETSIRQGLEDESWEKEFEENGMVQALKDAQGFEKDQYKLLLKLFGDLILNPRLNEAFKKGYNQCLKEQGKVGEKHQGLYL